MELKQITDRVYFMEFMDDTDRPVLGYIKGDKYSLAIDAGNSNMHVSKFYSLLSNSELSKPDYTVITHHHWDHTFGMNSISGKSIVCDITNFKLHEMKTWSWTENDMNIRIANGISTEFCKNNITKEYKSLDDIIVVTGDIIFKNELVIDLGGIECFIKHIQSPHTDDAVIIYIPNEKIVFVGDADCGDYTNLNGEYDKFKLESYIELIQSLTFDKYVIGHDKIESKETAMKYLYKQLAKFN
ncbi:MBL fold metallo-hydrolase [Paraclostridium sp. AKS46]|nr:MBL fold metallo-hydrolase [Paraclostridium sp. AKS46]